MRNVTLEMVSSAVENAISEMTKDDLRLSIAKGRAQKDIIPEKNIITQDDIKFLINNSDSPYVKIPANSDMSRIDKIGMLGKTFLFGPNCHLPKKLYKAIVGENSTINANFSGNSIIFKGSVTSRDEKEIQGRTKSVKMKNCIIDTMTAPKSNVVLDGCVANIVNNTRALKLIDTLANNVEASRIMLAGNSILLNAERTLSGEITINGNNNILCGVVHTTVNVKLEDNKFGNKVIIGELSDNLKNLINDSKLGLDCSQNHNNPSNMLLIAYRNINQGIMNELLVARDLNDVIKDVGFNLTLNISRPDDTKPKPNPNSFSM